jgi:hypothetical protein
MNISVTTFVAIFIVKADKLNFLVKRYVVPGGTNLNHRRTPKYYAFCYTEY